MPLRHSLMLRIGIAFALCNGLLVLALMLLLHVSAIDDEIEPMGPEVVIALVEHDLQRSEGQLGMRSWARVEAMAARHPGLWFIARDEHGSTLEFGARPSGVMARIDAVTATTWLALYRGLGHPDRRGDARSERIDLDGAPVLITAGGVDSSTLGLAEFFEYLQVTRFVWGVYVGTLVLTFCAALLASPLLLRSLRATARAAASLDGGDLAARLPEQAVDRELRPLVRGLNAALDRAEQAAERRRRFIADVAHELRTPLSILQLHADNVDGPAAPELRRTVQRLGQMVGQMLDTERLALASSRSETTDLVALGRRAVADAAPLAVAHGYDIEFHCAAERVDVRGDAHAIGRALANLIGNAIAHGGGRGAIRVRVDPDRAVDVSDEGPGVSEPARERIFEPFARERWDRDGCGLGLHLVREVMRAHGGDARLLPSARGALFRLQFP